MIIPPPKRLTSRNTAANFFQKNVRIEVFILSMPLVGVNFEPNRSSNWTDHWWFQYPGRVWSLVANCSEKNRVKRL